MTIISHRHRFVFVAVPKTGTHAIRRAIRGELAPDDEEQVSLFVEKRLSHPSLAQVGHGHLAASALRQVLGDSLWRDYLSFAFVRNPWDRFVSCCAFLTRDTDRFKDDPRACMRRILANPRAARRVHLRPQADLVAEPGSDEIIVDRVCRYEHLQRDFDTVSELLALQKKKLETVNSSSHAHFRDYYDDELVDAVRARYHRDIELFGYDFD